MCNSFSAQYRGMCVCVCVIKKIEERLHLQGFDPYSMANRELTWNWAGTIFTLHPYVIHYFNFFKLHLCVRYKIYYIKQKIEILHKLPTKQQNVENRNKK